MAAIARRFEGLSLRERALVLLAVLGLSIMCWDSLMMQPLRNARVALEAELDEASHGGGAAQSADLSDPRQVSIKHIGELQTQSGGIDAQLTSAAAGFVSADRMIELLHDVLERQQHLELVSIRNLPAISLVPSTETGAAPLPPYLHSVEIIIEGQYADILAYLAALEALPWKFRWTSLELSTAGYPRNRVRIELATLSLDATWLGV